MMPAKTASVESDGASKTCFITMEEILVLESDVKDNSKHSETSDIHNSVEAKNVVPNYKYGSEIDPVFESYSDERKNLAYVKYVGLNNSCNSSESSNDFLCLKLEQNLKHRNLGHCIKYPKKTVLELNMCSLVELQVLIEDLSRAVEDVSSELVQLLLDNDALQQESDARNVAIEQLLKMTVNNTESELRPIQMSVVLPPENCEDV